MVISSTRRQSHRKTRETQQAYCISPGDMKGTVITGLVLSVINLPTLQRKMKKQRKAMADKKKTKKPHTNMRTQTHTQNQGHL